MTYRDFVIVRIIIWIYCCKSLFCQNDLFVDGIDKKCENYHVNYLDEATNYTISWLSRKPPSYCKFNFKGKGTGVNINDKYKICVENIQYTVLDCDAEIKLFFEKNPPDKVYNCRNVPEKNAICGEEDKYFTLSIESKNGYANLNIYPSTFKFLVTAVKTYDAQINQPVPMTHVIIGVAAAVVVLISMVSILLICVRRRASKKLIPPVTEGTHAGRMNQTETLSSHPALLSDTSDNVVDPTAPPMEEIESLPAEDRRHHEPREHRRNHDRFEHGRTRVPREHRRHHEPREHRNNERGTDGRNQEHRRNREPREHRREPRQRPDNKTYDDPPPSYEMVMKTEMDKVS